MSIPDHSKLAPVSSLIKRFEANPDESPEQSQPRARSRSPVGRLPNTYGPDANANETQPKTLSSNSSAKITYSFNAKTEENVEQQDITPSSTANTLEEQTEVKQDESNSNSK